MNNIYRKIVTGLIFVSLLCNTSCFSSSLGGFDLDVDLDGFEIDAEDIKLEDITTTEFIGINAETVWDNEETSAETRKYDTVEVDEYVEYGNEDKKEEAYGPYEETTTAQVEETTGPAETKKPELNGEFNFEIHFIDVGQADSVLVICDGQAMLIDGGNKGDSNLLFTYLKKRNIDVLDYVIATHAHEDHIGGLPGALNYAVASKAYCPVTSYNSDAFDDLVDILERQDRILIVPEHGKEFELGNADDKNPWFSCCCCFLGVPWVHLWRSRGCSGDLAVV